MTIHVWTPRGFEYVDAEDFRLNWSEIRPGVHDRRADAPQALPMVHVRNPQK